MDEVDFLRGIEGEKQEGTDLVSGAEHLVRLKIQSGQETQHKYPDLELSKEAEVSESVGTAAMCKSCGKEKCACMSSKQKTAQVLKQALRDKLAQPDWNKIMLRAAAGTGAVVGGVGTYLNSRPQKDTGKSKTEEDLEGQVAANKMKPERGFLEKIKNREVENAHGISKAFREHPVKGSLLGALTGASLGYGIGQLGGAIARRGGK